MSIEINILEYKGLPGIQLRISPGAPKNEFIGMFGKALKIKIKARPEKGKANEELISFLAKQLGLKKSDIVLVRGHTAKTKFVAFKGCKRTDLIEKFKSIMG